MFCTNCGKEIDDHAKFCTYCGATMQADSSPSKPSTKIPVSSVAKKGVSPVLIGAVSVAALLAAAAVGGVLYLTSHNDAGAEQTVVSSEKRNKDKDVEKEEASARKSDDEETAPAASATSELLQSYLEEELIPQYGTANLGAQTKVFNLDTVYTEEEENRFWTESAGLSDAKIYDLDQDGDDELIVFLLTEEEINLCIYEATDDEIRQTVKYPQGRYSDMDGLELTWSLFNAGGTPYLFCHENAYGLVYDYATINAGLYQYDGNELYSPLVIAQTAGGSSDFVYTAYQYNAEGELLEEEVVYDETMEYLQESQPEYYYQRVCELFEAYGIHLDSEAALQEEQDIYQGVTDADEYEALLRLEMWGDYRYEEDSSTLVYHFNDFDSPVAFYRRFLSGEETVQIRKDAWYSESSRTEWSLKDIETELIDTHLEGNDRYLSIEYAYIDCGGDGVEELAVRFVGLDIYSQNDDSDLTMIITCSGETPEVVYSCESWARSYTSPRYHGCIPSSGSAGAGDHPFDMKYLDANGDLHTVYDAELLGGAWIRNLDSDVYDAAFSDSGDPSADVTHYQIDGVDYCIMHSYDTSSDLPCEQFIALCERKGMLFVTDDEIDEIIEQRAEELGIESDWLSEEELSWNYWY